MAALFLLMVLVLPSATWAAGAETRSAELSQVALWALLPVVATLCGVLIAGTREPGPKARSALQHLAAGIVFAAVATEIVPEMLEGGYKLSVVLGFSLGVVLMFGVRWATGGDTHGEAESGPSSVSASNMFIATGVDLAIDGLLIGVGFSLSLSSGVLLTIAVTFEVLFISMGLAATLRARGRTARFALVSLTLMASLTGACMLLGASLLVDLGDVAKACVLSFGAAALLYLVTEELLVEAHAQDADSFGGSMLFFLGFGMSLLGAMLL
ncbi:hypothetical protein MK489_20685 [Myxococcota bacterium]|nr:hypothetical protein [Myxococcota bacterium]